MFDLRALKACMIPLAMALISVSLPAMSSTSSRANALGVGSARQGLPKTADHESDPRRSEKMMSFSVLLRWGRRPRKLRRCRGVIQ